MGATRLFVMIVLVCAAVAWAIGQRERIADAAETLARKTAKESQVAAPAGTQDVVAVTRSGADEQGRTRIPDNAAERRSVPLVSDPAATPSGGESSAGPKEEAEEEVVVVRAGVRTGASADSQSQTRGLTLKASRDGHFYLKVRVNGTEIPFLVDTGASSVMLTREAARRARIYPKPNDYTMIAQTANGTVRMAPITVRDMRIGSFRTANVSGAVNQGNSGVSLLGMSFLRRLKRYEVKGDRLVLYW